MSTMHSTDQYQQAGEAVRSSASGSGSSGAAVLVCLPSVPAHTLQELVAAVSQAFSTERVAIASPDWSTEEQVSSTLRLVPYGSSRAEWGWTLAAGDYASATLHAEPHPPVTLLLGIEAASISVAELREFAGAVLHQGADLAVPRLALRPTQGLVNSALLYPTSRALFNQDVRFPLPLDVAMSPRMAARLATTGRRHTGGGQSDALLWPVAEAALAGFAVQETPFAERSLPQPQESDFNTLFASVASSFFTDVEAKAPFWQRAPKAPVPPASFSRANLFATAPDSLSDEVRSMIDGFHLAYANLHEIWSLVLPPQTLLALKKLSASPAESFSVAPALWARIVYDFILAFHLRTLNRGHLLGAFTPIYLGWTASLLQAAAGDENAAAEFLEGTARAFEAEKSYFVSRWRWPDRFNP